MITSFIHLRETDKQRAHHMFLTNFLFVVKEFVKLSDEQETDEKTKKEETI